MGVPYIVPDPAAIVELAPMRETLATVTRIGASAAPESVSVLGAASVVLVGIKVETTLLENEHWDNFWIGIGGRLNNVWNGVTNTLFGHKPSMSTDQVRSMVNYGLHVSLRMSRQLITGLAAQTSAIQSVLYKGVIAVARANNNLATWATGQLNHLRALEVADVTAAKHYAEGLAHNVSAGVDARIHAQVSALRAEMIRDILNPMKQATSNARLIADRALASEHTLEANLKAHWLPELAAATLISKEALSLARAAKQWEDDCGEPMCQSLGPKTPLGKLLARGELAALLATLVAITALDPDDVERAAEEFGRLFGPVLSRWASGWLGITSDDVSGIPGEVGRSVGSIGGNIIP